ncbi:MAG: glycerol-3-phosphate dehydrogenase/oxidase [Brevibacterium sp.]|uniref:glycerol-3-phosphate dehydrogenase/oxidase n=1 Tax=Brevibacterium sandarakinum TaxID=629680 RepID=UPI00264D4EEE|nr:glycerol-3-phosphate dehydrogenase/oxidase [Brevibacterium sandarakinum]MDN5585034.1 glycerol-3-phosphate dehydrogenase/oxidase [Brevibacterium sp.]MDN5656746.1 glycerol-3-phosphate dehydrogenase/oxidase [Brevibacterium sandarakinum]
MKSSTSGDAALNATRRTHDLAEAIADDEPIDLVVIGGGFTGVGVALDAAARGLSVVLVERKDLASGTSSWSSKLAHGGLRYLAKLDFPIAWESAVERGHLMSRIAPHLIRPMQMIFPLHSGVSRFDAALAGTGFLAGDVLRMFAKTPGSLLPHPSRISTADVNQLAPATAKSGLRGGLLSWDGQLVDDARFVVAIARTAAAHGARIITYASATGVEPGLVHFTDELTDDRHTIRAKQVVNAAGVWADSLSDDVELVPSKGSHLLVRAENIGCPSAAVTAPVPGHFGRFVFAVPWPDGLVMIGLTDDPHSGQIPERARPDEDECTFLLTTINTVLETPLTPEDIVGSYAGFRPLLKGRGETSADLSRKHALLRDPHTDVLTIVGGKLTGYRRMAEDAVDEVVRAGGFTAEPCRTTTLSLVGAGSPDPGASEHLVQRYGTDAATVAAYGADDPGLNQPVRAGIPLSGAEIRFAVEHELAVTVDDVVDRRTRWGLVDADREDLAAAVRKHAPELIDNPATESTQEEG